MMDNALGLVLKRCGEYAREYDLWQLLMEYHPSSQDW